MRLLSLDLLTILCKYEINLPTPEQRVSIVVMLTKNLTVQFVDNHNVRVAFRGRRGQRGNLRQILVGRSEEGWERRDLFVRLLPNGIFDEDEVSLVPWYLEKQSKGPLLENYLGSSISRLQKCF